MSTRRKILSSAYGEIRDSLLVYSGHWTENAERDYAQIAEHLHPKGKLFQFIHETPRKDLDQRDLHQPPGHYDLVKLRQEVNSPFNLPDMLEKWGKEIKSISQRGYVGYRRWAQDPFVVLDDRGEPVLLQSAYHARVCDYFLPLELARHPEVDLLVRPTELYLEGGNLLAGRHGAFVGKDLVRQNMFQRQESEAQVIADLTRELGVERLQVIGFDRRREKFPISPLVTRASTDAGSYQPLFHLDLFLTIGGMDGDREIIFLASPAAAREALGPQADKMTLDPAYDAYFETVRRSFDPARDRIVELPIFYRQQTLFSWNNCLVEIAPAGKTVYLPSYLEPDLQDGRDWDVERMNPAFERLQRAVGEVYAAEGFVVKWIESGRLFRRLARYGGSLHCVTKILRRAPFN